MIWSLGGRVLDFGDRVQIMGILNATPDSFYDCSRYLEPSAAIDRGLELIAEGASIIDIGGESSRPPIYGAADDVSAAEECRRVVPVVEGLRRQSGAFISVDTVKAEVAAQRQQGADPPGDLAPDRQETDPAAEKALQHNFCASCGAPRRDGDRFCPQCGVALAETG